jgi:hypothetical protein
MARAETRGTQGGTVCRIVGAIVCTGVCSVAEVTAAENLGMRALAGPPALTASARQAIARPVIRGAADARRAWLGAEHKGLTVQKVSNRIDRSLAIELRFRRDIMTISIDPAANVTVARGDQSVQLASADAYERLQQVLAGSEAVLAARLLLAERESESDLQPAEMSLLSTAAFVASLVGDVDAPRRLATRFVEKHRGVYRSVRLRNCFETLQHGVQQRLERPAELHGRGEPGLEFVQPRVSPRGVQRCLADARRNGLGRVHRLYGIGRPVSVR